MSQRTVIPASWDAVTPEWIANALAPTHPGLEVAGVEVLLRYDGTNRRARLGVTYVEGVGPRTVFLKASDPAHAALNARSATRPLTVAQAVDGLAGLARLHSAFWGERFDLQALSWVQPFTVWFSM